MAANRRNTTWKPAVAVPEQASEKRTFQDEIDRWGWICSRRDAHILCAWPGSLCIADPSPKTGAKALPKGARVKRTSALPPAGSALFDPDVVMPLGLQGFAHWVLRSFSVLANMALQNAGTSVRRSLLRSGGACWRCEPHGLADASSRCLITHRAPRRGSEAGIFLPTGLPCMALELRAAAQRAICAIRPRDACEAWRPCHAHRHRLRPARRVSWQL